MISQIFLVGMGGFLGSIGRYILGTFIAKSASTGIPYSTLAVNLIGSFLIGGLYSISDLKSYEGIFYFLVPGILGGFTTFSAFSGETLSLIQRHQYMQAALYLLLSVGGGLIACAAGYFLVKFAQP